MIVHIGRDLNGMGQQSEQASPIGNRRHDHQTDDRDEGVSQTENLLGCEREWDDIEQYHQRGAQNCRVNVVDLPAKDYGTPQRQRQR